MRNRGFPETQSSGTFVSAPPQQEKEKLAMRRATMRDQGQYMGAIRPLSAAQRAQVKKLRAAKGAEAAIALAHKFHR
jgi:hypothetical protein